MKPYKHIEDSKKVLKSLISEARTMDNVKTRLTELNTLIKLVNSFEEMLNKKYFTDYFDILLLKSMFEEFMKHKIYEGNDIPIIEFTEITRANIRIGKDNQLAKVKDLLTTYEAINKQNLSNWHNDAVDWDSLIKSTLLELKKEIQWKNK
jgi:hypothetical protein